MESIISKWGIESLRQQKNSIEKLALQIRFFFEFGLEQEAETCFAQTNKKAKQIYSLSEFDFLQRKLQKYSCSSSSKEMFEKERKTEKQSSNSFGCQ